LPWPAFDRVAAHIEGPCPRCVVALGKLGERAAPLLAGLREPPPISAAEAEEVCQFVLERVLGSDCSTTDWEPWSRSAATALDNKPPELRGYEVLMPPVGERDGWPRIGGMGVVWRVRDLQFQRPIAVKVMKAESADARRACRFLAEASI